MKPDTEFDRVGLFQSRLAGIEHTQTVLDMFEGMVETLVFVVAVDQALVDRGAIVGRAG